MERTPMTDGWITWRPLMVKAIAETKGPILELGAGDGSTPFLHALADSQYRHLLTLEGNKEWAARFLRYEGPLHGIMHVPDWAACEHMEHPVLAQRWGCVLVDHAPGERRVVEIERLADLADVLVIHDTEPAARHGYGYDKIWHLFKHIRHDWPAGEKAAWATAVSNTIAVGDWKL